MSPYGRGQGVGFRKLPHRQARPGGGAVGTAGQYNPSAKDAPAGERGELYKTSPSRGGGLSLRALGLEDQQALDAVFEEGGKLPPELVPALAVDLQLLAEGVWNVVGHVDLLGGDPRLL